MPACCHPEGLPPDAAPRFVVKPRFRAVFHTVSVRLLRGDEPLRAPPGAGEKQGLHRLEFWWRVKEDLDRPVSGREILLRFATSQYAYRRLLQAARFGRLEALYDPHRRTWVTTREAVEASQSSDCLTHDLDGRRYSDDGIGIAPGPPAGALQWRRTKPTCGALVGTPRAGDGRSTSRTKPALVASECARGDRVGAFGKRHTS
jgi:hypothetical protein